MDRLLMAVCMDTVRNLVRVPMGPGRGMANLTGAFFPQECPNCKRVAGMNPYTGQWSRHGDCEMHSATVVHEDHQH